MKKLMIGILIIIMIGCIGFTTYMINKEPDKVEPIYEKADYGDVIIGTPIDRRIKDDVRGFSSFLDPMVKNPVTVLSFEANMLSGLKDKTIEKKINTEINKDRMSGGVSYDVTNYSNVLSIVHNDSNGKHVRFSNFRLDTGERLKFEEIFTSDANIVQFLATGIYETLAFNSCPNYGFGRSCSEKDTAKINYEAIEEETFRLVNYYKMNGIKEFGIDHGYVYFKIDNSTWFRTYIGDYYKDVALYNRFKSKTDIYEKSINVEKYDTVFGRSYWLYMHKKLSDNLYIEAYGDALNSETNANLNNTIAKVKSMASKNSNKAYYLVFNNVFGDNWVTINLFEADRNYFDENIQGFIIKSYKHINNSAPTDVSDYFKDNKNFKKINIQ